MKASLKGRVVLVAVASAVVTSCLVATPAQAGTYSYAASISCGTLSGVRQAALIAHGSYSADLAGSGYDITWKDHISQLSYTACGSAAPFGSYLVNASAETLVTQFKVSSTTLKNCKLTAATETTVDATNPGIKGSLSGTCSFSSKLAKEQLKSPKKAGKYSRLIQAATIAISGTYCNTASLYVKATVTDTANHFSAAPIELSKQTLAC